MGRPAGSKNKPKKRLSIPEVKENQVRLQKEVELNKEIGKMMKDCVSKAVGHEHWQYLQRNSPIGFIIESHDGIVTKCPTKKYLAKNIEDCIIDLLRQGHKILFIRKD